MIAASLAVARASPFGSSRSRADLELHADVRQQERVAERDQLTCPLRRHDPGEPGSRERVPFRERRELSRSLRGHPHHRASAGTPAGDRLSAHVDHAHRSGFIDM
jgi:hypothetical protein